MFFNDLIALFLEGCLEFMIAGYITVTNPIFNSYGEWLSLIQAYINLLMSSLVMPVFILVFIF